MNTEILVTRVNQETEDQQGPKVKLGITERVTVAKMDNQEPRVIRVTMVKAIVALKVSQS